MAALREQLCKAEQSFGVCHVAEPILWSNEAQTFRFSGTGRQPPLLLSSSAAPAEPPSDPEDMLSEFDGEIPRCTQVEPMEGSGREFSSVSLGSAGYMPTLASPPSSHKVTNTLPPPLLQSLPVVTAPPRGAASSPIEQRHSSWGLSSSRAMTINLEASGPLSSPVSCQNTLPPPPRQNSAADQQSLQQLQLNSAVSRFMSGSESQSEGWRTEEPVGRSDVLLPLPMPMPSQAVRLGAPVLTSPCGTAQLSTPAAHEPSQAPAPPSQPQLPQQLANARRQLRVLVACTESLQAATTQIPGSQTRGAPSLEMLESQHSMLMERARHLLASCKGSFSAPAEPSASPMRASTVR